LFAHTRDAHRTCDRVVEWIVQRDERPFFLWVHLFDPHRPYTCHERDVPDFGSAEVERLEQLEGSELAELAERGSRYYDSEIRHADDAVGRLLEALREDGSLESTVVIVMSDHGEHMDEPRLAREQWFGHSDVFEECCRVPLVIWCPGTVGVGAVSEQVSVMDVAPTVLELSGVSLPDGLTWRGRSLAGLIRGAPWASVPLVVDANPHSGTDVEGRALRDGRWKYVTRPDGGLELYDLSGDPDELLNVAHKESDRLEGMSFELARIVHDWMDTSLPEPDAETREKLRALGYIQ
jgi:arylsulfatase A-like enzyme